MTAHPRNSDVERPRQRGRAITHAPGHLTRPRRQPTPRHRPIGGSRLRGCSTCRYRNRRRRRCGPLRGRPRATAWTAVCSTSRRQGAARLGCARHPPWSSTWPRPRARASHRPSGTRPSMGCRRCSRQVAGPGASGRPGAMVARRGLLRLLRSAATGEVWPGTGPGRRRSAHPRARPRRRSHSVRAPVASAVVAPVMRSAHPRARPRQNPRARPRRRSHSVRAPVASAVVAPVMRSADPRARPRQDSNLPMGTFPPLG